MAANEEASSTPLSPGAARAAALERRRLKQLQQEQEQEETPIVVVALPPPSVATETVTKPLPNPVLIPVANTVINSVINPVQGRSVSPPPSPPPLTPSMLRKNQLQEQVYTSSADSGDQEVSHIDWHEENVEVEVEVGGHAEQAIANRYDFFLVFGFCYLFWCVVFCFLKVEQGIICSFTIFNPFFLSFLVCTKNSCSSIDTNKTLCKHNCKQHMQ